MGTTRLPPVVLLSEAQNQAKFPPQDPHVQVELQLLQLMQGELHAEGSLQAHHHPTTPHR